MLEKRDVSRFFSQPVSDTFAPGYSTIIKEPMDFSTMQSKIGTGICTGTESKDLSPAEIFVPTLTRSKAGMQVVPPLVRK